MPPSTGRKLVISVSGKGGAGKSTVTALMLKVLVEAGGRTILAVDADPASNLADMLGVPVDMTVAKAAEELRRAIDSGSIPPGVSKKDILEFKVYASLKELKGFDLLVMGRGEGEGCYCYINSVLTGILDTLTKNYDITIMDMEAGLEHISRRTDRDVDYMLVVVDPSKMSFETARRIKEVAQEVHVEFKRMFLVGNRFTDGSEDYLARRAEELGMEYGGLIPEDPTVYRFNLEGRPLLELPGDAPAVRAARRVLARLGLL
ncbi:ATP-binding protein [Candidatus Geothermarchaeota archaeon ex4572_27]|nr:MAG: ATP-binding protein [Candidatus Geothermarchaeota archaeon ex4572_27]